jgi:very-short-patch-repair endonuclease
VTISFDQTGNSRGSTPTAQQRLLDLLEYIEHVEKMNRTPLFDVPAAFYAMFEEDFRSLPEIETNLAGDEVWLRIPRLNEKAPPDPSAALKPWVVLSKSPDTEPTLREQIRSAGRLDSEEVQWIRRSDLPQVDSLFRLYLSGPWATWAATERPRRAAIAAYNKLFLLHQALEAEGTDTPLELAWGIGVAVWRHPSGKRIRYPLITQLVEVGLDRTTLALEVRPRERLPTLETDAYADLEVSGVVRLEAMWKKYLESADTVLSPFDRQAVAALLKPAAGFLDASGQYWPETQPPSTGRGLPNATENLIVTDTWVLFARKRSPNFLIDDLQRLRQSLQGIDEIPEGPAALVTELPDEVVAKERIYFRGRSYSGGGPTDGPAVRELYFPKPYNDEQVSIVEKLERSAGVVVQGPPGTGKTHTIANVICHYLARGKRVLVTSKGEPALAVLRGQIPESIRALTVSLLTDERDGMRQFEHAIQTIASNVSRIQPEEVERRIAGLQHRLEQLHATLSAVDHDIAAWARRHLEAVEFEGRKVLPYELAKRVVEREAEYSWFPDQLTAEFSAPQMTEQDIQQLRVARRRLGRDLEYLDIALPASGQLASQEEIQRIHEALLGARRLQVELAERDAVPLLSDEPFVLTCAAQLSEELSECIQTYEQVYERGIAGTEVLHQAFATSGAETLRRLEEVVDEAQRIEQERQPFVSDPVSIPGDADLDSELRDAIGRLCAGKSATGLFSLSKSELKAKLAGISVSGAPPDAQIRWEHVRLAVEFQRKSRALVARWNAVASEFGLPAADQRATEGVRRIQALSAHVEAVRRLAIDHRVRLAAMSGAVFGTDADVLGVMPSKSKMAEVRQTLRDHLAQHELKSASAAAGRQMELLQDGAGAVSSQLRSVLEDQLGRDGVAPNAIGKRWSDLLSELRRLEALRPSQAEVRRVAILVEASGASLWANALRTQAVNGSVDSLLPGSWLEAWRWRQAANFIDAIDGRKALRALQTKRSSSESDLAKTYQDLVEAKTWIEVHRNSPPAVKAALQAYLNAVRAIGKGTGIRAARHRKAARAAMLDAYRAVPCWIMPQWRVSETLPPEIGKFDLVIVDEASQSDLWVLPALLRGSKIMVVGDDKQVSPDGIGLAEERIKDLKNRFLGSQVHGDQMTPEKSMYDLAKVVFAGEMVMLREHFRCVPPIIEFSKREFYNHELQPLRVANGLDRLDPPLIDVFVRGARRADKVNAAEARAIVDEIQSIVKDPACAKRSIGVVSLLGIEQAHTIFEMIRSEVPAEEIAARQITVGDARTFQGKERDIMLLSMVSTPDKSKAVTARMYEQRFNVAASRARDRMYLFRSVELVDLSKDDLKAKLIEHFRAPFREEPARVRALRELCESDFEREMFDQLTQAGYRVRPQVRVGAHRIDLVIEGEEDRRLAVECDGDQYHGPEQWAHDAARQRILERAGWTFWRCFGSSFNRDRKVVIQDLFDTLTSMGISPIGAAEAESGSYSEHRVVSPFEEQPNEESATAKEADEPNAASPASPASADSKVDGSAESALQGFRPRTEAPAHAERDVRRAGSAQGEDAGRPAAQSEPNSSMAGVQIGIPLHCGDGVYTEDQFRAFALQNRLVTVDNRDKSGALWVKSAVSPGTAQQLKTWGFQFVLSKGWWRK